MIGNGFAVLLSSNNLDLLFRLSSDLPLSVIEISGFLSARPKGSFNGVAFQHSIKEGKESHFVIWVPVRVEFSADSSSAYLDEVYLQHFQRACGCFWFDCLGNWLERHLRSARNHDDLTGCRVFTCNKRELDRSASAQVLAVVFTFPFTCEQSQVSFFPLYGNWLDDRAAGPIEESN